MHRLPLILCAIALLGSAASAVLFFRIGDSKRILESRLADSTAQSAKLETALASSNELAGSLKAQVSTSAATAAALESELTATRTRLAATETRATALERDFAQAKTVLGVYEQTARALADEVAALREDLEDARSSQASPEAVEGYRNTITELERQLANARNGAAAPNVAGAANAVFSLRSGRATVLSVGPGSAFVVVNYGTTRGAQIGQKLNVSQGTEVVATALISDVRTNFSIAHVLPDSLRGVLHKGDSALLIR